MKVPLQYPVKKRARANYLAAREKKRKRKESLVLKLFVCESDKREELFLTRQLDEMQLDRSASVGPVRHLSGSLEPCILWSD